MSKHYKAEIDTANLAEKPFRTLFERQFTSLMSPLESFIQKQTTSGILLILFSIIAFILANSPLREFAANAGHLPMSIAVGNLTFSIPVKDLIGHGLMTLFFFVTGLELKREIIAGRLTNLKEVRLVCAAALGGIAVPALSYYIFNVGTESSHGWAIPTATDTAFAIAILACFASRISIGLTIFLTALAIFDDIGAIAIISVFYAHEISITAVMGSLLVFSTLILANKAGIRNAWIYVILGILLWFFVLKAGIHPTSSGLLLAIAIPARASISQSRFILNIKNLLNHFELKQEPGRSMLGSSSRHALVSDIGKNALAASTPLQRWEHSLLLPIAVIVLPLFALFNAGFPLSQEVVIKGLSSPITLGIITGLVVGKPLGIMLFSYVALKSKFGILPHGVGLKDVVGVSILAGIGFTMSIFITSLSFPKNEEMIELAKLGILSGSLISAFLGSIWIYLRFPIILNKS